MSVSPGGKKRERGSWRGGAHERQTKKKTTRGLALADLFAFETRVLVFSTKLVGFKARKRGEILRSERSRVSGGEEVSGDAIGRINLSFSDEGENREEMLVMDAKEPARNVGLRFVVAVEVILREGGREERGKREGGSWGRKEKLEGLRLVLGVQKKGFSFLASGTTFCWGESSITGKDKRSEVSFG